VPNVYGSEKKKKRKRIERKVVPRMKLFLNIIAPSCPKSYGPRPSLHSLFEDLEVTSQF
jgi:hypothetical protein